MFMLTQLVTQDSKLIPLTLHFKPKAAEQMYSYRCVRVPMELNIYSDISVGGTH